MAPVVGIEPTLRVLETLALPLYYTDNDGPCGEIRTPDPLVPNQMLYQAEPHTDKLFNLLVKLEIKNVFKLLIS